MTDIEIITKALNVIDAYINNGAPLPPKTDPYWHADAAINAIRSRLAAFDRLSAAPGESAKQFHPVEDGSGTLVCPLNPSSESARELAHEIGGIYRDVFERTATITEQAMSKAAAKIESSWARVREECVESWKTAMRECAEILPNKVECVLTGSDIERIEAAILAQPKEAGA